MSTSRIGTCILLINKENQVLLGKRKNSYGEGEYGLPGGRVDKDESIDEAAIREVYEETGLIVEKLSGLGAIHEQQESGPFVHFAFYKKDDFENPKLMEPGKCEAWEWIDFDNLNSKKILAGHLQAISRYMLEV